MDHDAFLTALREESERFLTVLDRVDRATAVPSCDGWTAADLLWHLGCVQHRWAQIAGGADGDTVPEPERPADDDLAPVVAVAGTELLAALAERPPDTPAWSWHPDGGSLAWIARRQAHEALIHRVDAELTAGVPVAPPVSDLAADGVDEVLRHFVHGVPAWGTFTPDGTSVRLETTNDPQRSWVLTLGRFTGTSPATGSRHDVDAGMLLDVAGPAGEVSAVIRGRAWELDLWLWGRGPADTLRIEGDPAVVARLEALMRDATS